MNVWNIIATIGALLLLGTAGASDFSNLPMTQVLVQCAVSLALIVVGSRGSSARARAARKNKEASE